MMWGYGWSWGGYGMMMLSMIIFWGLVIWAIVAIVRHVGLQNAQQNARAPSSHVAPIQTAQEILAMRFAKGEIDADEYAHRLEVLTKKGSAA
jgi:putative membrane protein